MPEIEVNGGGGAGSEGPRGPEGKEGLSVLNGEGKPAEGTGINGDWYIDTKTTIIYGPKAAGKWPEPGTKLIGPEGPKGATGPEGAKGATGPEGPTGPEGLAVLHGSGKPTAGTGINGDFYIDTTAHVIYGPKAAGAWPEPGTELVGPKGAEGAKGEAGATGAKGEQGQAGGSSFAYTFTTETTKASATAKKCAFNNATLSSVTEVFANEEDAAGSKTKAWFETFAKGGLLNIFDNSNAANFLNCEVTAAPTLSGGIFTIAVKVIASGGTMDTTASDTVLSYVPPGKEGSGGTVKLGAATRTGRVVGTEYEPSATKVVQVVLTFTAKTAEFARVQLLVGEILYGEVSLPLIAAETQHGMISFLCPAKTKWKLVLEAGSSLPELWSVYTPFE